MVPARLRDQDDDRTPLAVPGWEGVEGPSAGLLRRATIGFVVLGMVLRVARYAINQPLWGDEAFLAASLIDRGYGELLRPLDYYQVAPLLFLWAELAAVRLLGFAEWSLRLFPMLCGVASVPLFALVARRTLANVPALLAVAIFAVSFYPIRYASEVKPYATDLLAAISLLAPAVVWWRSRGSARPLWLLAAAGPLALGFSYPAVFVGGGISLALLAPVVRSGRRGVLAAYAAFNAALVAAFLALYVLVIRGQSAQAGPGMHRYWAEAFPPTVLEPIRLLLWLLEVHTSRTFAYPVGEANGGSALTTLLVVVGGLAIWRVGRRDLLALLLAPFGLGLLAAFAGRYPYGGSARTMQYVAPAICLMAGLGAARLIGAARRPGRRVRLLGSSAAVLVGIGLVAVGMDVARPYKFVEDERARQFARRFWVEQARGAELACVHRDLGVTIDAHHWQTGRTAVYLCNQAIYAAGRRPPDLGRVSTDRPLRCVLYNLGRNHPEFAAWMESMLVRYRVRRVVTYEPVPRAIIGGLEYEDRYDVIEFVPRDADEAPQVARRGDPAGATR